MNQSELEAVVAQVTREVMAALGRETPAPQNEGRCRLLVLGDPDAALPEELGRDSVRYYLEDYVQNRNILRYDRVIITALSTTQLADIALARAGDDLACAVIQALLNGIDTYLTEAALSFRKYAGKGSTALYKTLENYVRLLQVFGVKLLVREGVSASAPGEVRPPRYKAPPIRVPAGTGTPNAGLLINEEAARALLRQGSPVHLPPGAIVTPLARDLFSHAGAEILRDA